MPPEPRHSGLDVLLLGSPPGPGVAPLVLCLDRLGIRVIADVEGLDCDAARIRRIAAGCSGVISAVGRTAAIRDGLTVSLAALPDGIVDKPHLVLVEPRRRVETRSRQDRTLVTVDGEKLLEMPSSLLFGPAELPAGGAALSAPARRAAEAFATRAGEDPVPPPYAYLIGRLERDFTHAREAIRAAVESEAGVPCHWSGDGRHRGRSTSVRATTQEALAEAALVVADLTLGPENPQSENPSRAHEIGLAVAFDRPLMLCSREPRRHPYFSVGDLQMFFWSDERDLHQRASAWLRAKRGAVGRTVLNHRLGEWQPGEEPRMRPATFEFDHRRRYLWPLTRPFSELELLAMALSLGAVAWSLLLAGGLGDRLGPDIYLVAALVAALAMALLPRWTRGLRAALGRAAALLPALLAVGALVLTALVLLGGS